MKYFEFGQENEKTLLILCGFGVCWTPRCLLIIEEAKKEYHVIVAAYDGYNPEEPDTVFISVIDEAEKISEYLVGRFDGKIDIIYGMSLGGMVMTEILMDDRISVHTAIADGFTIIQYPNFPFDFMKRMLAGVIASGEYWLFQKHKKLVAKFLGIPVKQLDTAIYPHAAKESYFNAEYSLMPYRYKYEAFARADSYIWHGDHEKSSIKKVRKLREQGYKFTHKIFANSGHGGLSGDPQQLMEEINRAVKGMVRKDNE